MANMNRASESATESIFGATSVTSSLANLLRAYEESAKNQLDAENELNKLRISNLMKLGLLKKGQ